MINTLLEPDLNSLMITSRSFWSMSPCCQGGESSVSGCQIGRQRTQERRRGAYQSGDGEVPRVHLLRQPVNFSPGVEEDDSLRDGQRLIQITQGVQLPLLETGKQRM